MADVLDVNVETGEETLRNYTAEEKAIFLSDKTKSDAMQAEAEAEAAIKATAKAVLLAKLGITADEAALLLS